MPFACHTDAEFLASNFCPRGLPGLFGLLNEPRAHTAVLPLDRILEAAPPSLVQALEKADLPPPLALQFSGLRRGDRADPLARP